MVKDGSGKHSGERLPTEERGVWRLKMLSGDVTGGGGQLYYKGGSRGGGLT